MGYRLFLFHVRPALWAIRDSNIVHNVEQAVTGDDPTVTLRSMFGTALSQVGLLDDG